MRIPKKIIVNNKKYRLLKLYSKYALYQCEYGWKECFLYSYFIVKEAERRREKQKWD